MITKRIIPCLDVKEGRVVKGVSFEQLRDAGNPIELAALYDREGADELIFLDISATLEGRKTMLEVVKQAATELSIPFTVGGGISSVEDMYQILQAGADKVSINTAAILQPELIRDGARRFGSQSVVVAIDVKYDPEVQDWWVYSHGGTIQTERKAREWAKEAVERGAGEILLTSMDRDGHQDGFDLPLTRLISEEINVPVIASGGAGNGHHFVDVFTQTGASAALAASIFHFQEVTIQQVKSMLREKGIEMR